MQIGSNNSLTYLKPSTWLGRLFSFFTRHQESDYQDQYTFHGIRLFDIRLYTDEKNRLLIRNGYTTYPLSTFYGILDYLDRKCDTTVLITFDESYTNHLDDYSIKGKEQKFIETCGIIERIYKNIKFCGGYRRFDREILYNFGNEIPNIICPENESLKYKFFNKFCPLLTVKYNKRFIEKYKDTHGFLLLNYVNRK